MYSFKSIKAICLFITILSFFIAIPSFANDPPNTETIYSSSIQWTDEANKEKILQSVPKWHDDVVKSLFAAYTHPEQYQLTKIKDAKLYNIQFINAFWGPIHNPFNKYERPAKAFVFVEEINHDSEKLYTFYMAPMVQNLADNNYYVFDQQSQPTLLNDWVANIRNIQGNEKLIRFNICNGYGNFPTDSCTEKSYQNEIKDIYNRTLLKGIKTITASPESNIPSAYRDIHEDWKTKAAAHRIRESVTSARTTVFNRSIYDNSISWQNVAARNQLLATVFAWPNYKVISENFKKIRDIRFFDDEDSHHFLRRITWLYPDDGCWTRATAVIQGLFGPYHNIASESSRPSKVFAFGNLCAKTPNSRSGRVSWWYHTAPIVRDAETNQSYVLDPSVNPYQPLEVEQWMAEITATSGPCASSSNRAINFSICNGFGVSPYDSCEDSSRVTYITEANSIFGQSSYRHFERMRQMDLGRDADNVLGSSPPWLD